MGSTSELKLVALAENDINSPCAVEVMLSFMSTMVWLPVPGSVKSDEELPYEPRGLSSAFHAAPGDHEPLYFTQLLCVKLLVLLARATDVLKSDVRRQ